MGRVDDDELKDPEEEGDDWGARPKEPGLLDDDAETLGADGEVDNIDDFSNEEEEW